MNIKISKLTLICLFLYIGSMAFSQTNNDAKLRKLHAERTMSEYIEIMLNPINKDNVRMQFYKAALNLMTNNASIIVERASDSEKLMAKDYFMRISNSLLLLKVILVDCEFADNNKISMMRVREYYRN